MPRKVKPKDVLPGSVIRFPTGFQDEVLEVVVVYRMKNGAQPTFTDEDEIEVVADPPSR